MDKFNKLKAVMASLDDDADKFYAKGNNAAGTRLRNALQEIKVLSQELRKEIQEQKNAKKA